MYGCLSYTLSSFLSFLYCTLHLFPSQPHSLSTPVLFQYFLAWWPLLIGLLPMVIWGNVESFNFPGWQFDCGHSYWNHWQTSQNFWCNFKMLFPCGKFSDNIVLVVTARYEKFILILNNKRQKIKFTFCIWLAKTHVK